MKWLLSKLTIRTIPLFALIVLLFIYAQPQAMLMLGGIPLILIGEAVRLWAAGHLSKNKEVTNTGPYAYVKNPLYIGTFLVMIGFCMVAAQWELLVLGLGVFFFYYAPKKKEVESDRLREIFGEAWDDYDKSVPDYIPKLTPYQNRSSHRWEWVRVVANSEHQTATSALTGIILMGVRFFF